MAKKNLHTNIMLDMECTDANSHNPIILELAAVHFHIDTGAELDSFRTIISYDSCVNHGLDAEDTETIEWLEDHIPKTLALSKSSTKSLEEAMSEFAQFIEKCKAQRLRMSPGLRKTEVVIWGNGATADNIWIRTAYKVCNMEIQWQYYNNKCVRTFVRLCNEATDRNFMKENTMAPSKKHLALEDCRNQITYLVKARSALFAQSQQITALKRQLFVLQQQSRPERMLSSPETSFSSTDGEIPQSIARGLSSLQTLPNDRSTSRRVVFKTDVLMEQQITPRMRPTPETAYSITYGEYLEEIERNRSSPQGVEPLGDDPSTAQRTSTRNTKSVQTEPLDTTATTPEQLIVTGSPNFTTNESTQKRKWNSGEISQRRIFATSVPRQLPTPETSFSAKEYDVEYKLGKQQEQPETPYGSDDEEYDHIFQEVAEKEFNSPASHRTAMR